MADDSIIIDIEVNDEKAQAELKRLEKQINKLNDELSKNKNKQNVKQRIFLLFCKQNRC